MSKNKDKIIGVKIKLSECSHGNLHVTGIEPIRESDTVYSAPDADAVLSKSLRWSRSYVENWEANFGDRPEPPQASENDVN